jgi:hypothetical protein
VVGGGDSGEAVLAGGSLPGASLVGVAVVGVAVVGVMVAGVSVASARSVVSVDGFDGVVEAAVVGAPMGIFVPDEHAATLTSETAARRARLRRERLDVARDKDWVWRTALTPAIKRVCA